jgi:hypothetical protein
VVDRTTGEDGGVRDIPADDAQPDESPFALLTIAEFLDLPTAPPLVLGVMRAGELAVLYGEPSSYKTFVALDLALKVAAGMSWWGHSVSSGSVLYFAGEARSGLKKRIRAWAFEHKVDPRTLAMRLLPHAIALLDEGQFQKLLASIARLERMPALIVVDTLARFMIGGDENSTQDMGAFVARCASLQQITGATVVIVHHKGKGAASERGSSALRGAADVMINVERTDFGPTLVGDKAKDDAPLERLLLEAKRVWLGPSGDGDDEYSLALVARDVGVPSDSTAGRTETPGGKKTDPGEPIRRALAIVFAQEPVTGPTLKAASGLGRSTFYAVLGDEIEAGRIDALGGGRSLKYRLGVKAAEYRAVSPSPSPSPEHTSDLDSEVESSVVRQSESTTPLKGVVPDSDSDSSEVSSPQQKKSARRVRGGPESRGAA